MNLNHKNLISILNFTDANENTYCGDFNKLTIYFEYFFLDLEKELTRRRQTVVRKIFFGYTYFKFY